MQPPKKYPKISVKIIFKWEEKILMFRYPSGVNDLPGGTMEWGESTMETLRRELREELDYELQGEPELFEVYNDIEEEKDRHRVQLQYIQRLNAEPRFTSLEGVEYHWLDKEEAKRVFGEGEFLERIFEY